MDIDKMVGNIALRYSLITTFSFQKSTTLFGSLLDYLELLVGP